MLQETDISRVRTGLLFLVGLSCLVYALLAIGQNTPRPMLWYIPTLCGVLAAFGIMLAFALGDRDARQMAVDEMYQHQNHRAQRHAYWVAIALYPVFALLHIIWGLSWETCFAAMGCLSGAAYLLLHTVYEITNP